jgi:hypothetical protein
MLTLTTFLITGPGYFQGARVNWLYRGLWSPVKDNFRSPDREKPFFKPA